MPVKEPKKVPIIIISICCFLDIVVAIGLYEYFSKYGFGPLQVSEAKPFGGLIIMLIFVNYFLYFEIRNFLKTYGNK